MTSPPKLFLASVDGHRMSDPVQLPCDVEPPLDNVCGKCKHDGFFIPYADPPGTSKPECVKCGMVASNLVVRVVKMKT